MQTDSFRLKPGRIYLMRSNFLWPKRKSRRAVCFLRLEVSPMLRFVLPTANFILSMKAISRSFR